MLIIFIIFIEINSRNKFVEFFQNSNIWGRTRNIKVGADFGMRTPTL